MAYEDTLYKVRIKTVAGEVEAFGGSYAGVPFFIEDTEFSGGRNVSTKELAFSDSHVNEDSSKKATRYSFNIYLIGEDVNSQVANLESAFTKRGFFSLVHPYFGTLQVRCNDYNFSFVSSENEYVTGSVSFVQEGDVSFSPKPTTDLRGESKQKSAGMLDAAVAAFGVAFSMVGKVKSVVDNVASFTDEILDGIQMIRGTVNQLSDFVGEISKIRANIGLALSSPGDFAARIAGLITMTNETMDDPFDNIHYVNESLSVMALCRVPETPSPMADEMKRSIARLVENVAAANVVQSLVDARFASVDEANEMQTRILDAFETASMATDDVNDYLNLVDLQATALKYLRDNMSKIAVVLDLPLNMRRDALSVCFDTYGNLDKLEDILDRNGIIDPLCITRKTLKVLSE